MPPSRDCRCRQALKTFFDRYDVEYEIVNLNIHGYSSARYEVKMLSMLNRLEPNYDRETRIFGWISHDIEQTLPPIDDVCAAFTDTFQPHEKPSAFMRIHETETTETGIVFKLLVKYFKSELPFAEDEITLETRIHQLERHNDILSNRLRDYQNTVERYIGPIRRRNHRLARERDDANEAVSRCRNVFSEHYSRLMESYRHLLRDCYRELDKKVDDCPVCYEPITNDKLYITPCRHNLCTGCAIQCKNTCPMCREEMCFIPNSVN